MMGILDAIKDFVTAPSMVIAVGTVVIGYVLKRIPNDKIQKVIGSAGYGFGVFVTGGLSKFKFSAPFWNKIIEPYFIDLIDNVGVTFIKDFIKGLRSDNK